MRVAICVVSLLIASVQASAQVATPAGAQSGEERKSDSLKVYQACKNQKVVGLMGALPTITYDKNTRMMTGVCLVARVPPSRTYIGSTSKEGRSSAVVQKEIPVEGPPAVSRRAPSVRADTTVVKQVIQFSPYVMQPDHTLRNVAIGTGILAAGVGAYCAITRKCFTQETRVNVNVH